MLKQSTFLSSLNKFGDALKIVVGAGIIAGVIRVLLEFLSSFHWILGAILAAALVIAAVWITHYIKQSARGEDPGGVLAILALGLMTVMVVCGWVSFTLHAANAATYSVPQSYSAGTFVDLYLYTFLDLLPGIEVLKTLNLKQAIEPLTVLGGLPILAFKLFVVWLFFDAFLSWRKIGDSHDAQG